MITYEKLCNAIINLIALLAIAFVAVADEQSKDHMARALGVVGSCWILLNLIRLVANQFRKIVDYFGGF